MKECQNFVGGSTHCKKSIFGIAGARGLRDDMMESFGSFGGCRNIIASAKSFQLSPRASPHRRESFHLWWNSSCSLNELVVVPDRKPPNVTSFGAGMHARVQASLCDVRGHLVRVQIPKFHIISQNVYRLCPGCGKDDRDKNSRLLSLVPGDSWPGRGCPCAQFSTARAVGSAGHKYGLNTPSCSDFSTPAENSRETCTSCKTLSGTQGSSSDLNV